MSQVAKSEGTRAKAQGLGVRVQGVRTKVKKKLMVKGQVSKISVITLAVMVVELHPFRIQGFIP